MKTQLLKMISTQGYDPLDNLSEGEKAIFSPSSYGSNTEVDQESLWTKIFENLKLILASEFSSDIKRQAVAHQERISFACVYCGDSHKDMRKKRGNLFSRTMQYHCFNGDCNAHMSIYDFLKDKGHLQNFNLEEQLFMKQCSAQRSLDLKRLKTALGMETFFSDEISDLSVERSFFMKKMGLQEIKGTKMERYLLGRMQRDFNKFAWNPKDQTLFVFNLDSTFQKVIGAQIKTFNKRNPYLTWKISRIHLELGIYEDSNQEALEKMDFLSNIFGIFQADLNKPITVFEGPLDSFLFPNSVALCSAKNSMPFEIDGSRYFYDNDDTGRDYSLKRINEGKPVFLWRKFLTENELLDTPTKIKDLNDLLIHIKKSGKPCKRFVDYFSDSKYDAYWI